LLSDRPIVESEPGDYGEAREKNEAADREETVSRERNPGGPAALNQDVPSQRGVGTFSRSPEMRVSVRRVALLAVATFLAVGVAGDALAGKKVNPTVKAQDHALAQELHQVRHTLSVANHDYNGHRVKAMHEIHQAVHQLKKEAHLRGQKGTPAAPGGAEPQPVSDAQIADSTKALAGLLAQVNSLPATPRRAQAAGHINAAIKQLGLALEFRKKVAAKQ
jgi:hypothetical protein